MADKKPLIQRLLNWVRRRTRKWARRRHGVDPDPVVLSGRRIYIVPSRLGVTYAFMLFAMFMGSMNYANNLALALTFLLGSMGLVAMHYCQRNLAGIRIASAACEPVFAGQQARFRIALEYVAPLARHELSIGNDHGSAAPVRIEAASRTVLEIRMPAPQRGYLTLDQFEILTRYPFGMFRAWAYLNLPVRCIVYPKPSDRGVPPPPLETDTGGPQDHARGDEDFAGLRRFHPGDSPRHVAWKAYAREQGLHVKVYAGTAVTSHMFDWQRLEGLDVEERLAQLCRWIEDAHTAGHAFGLRLPETEVPPNIGPAHRERCLTALALFKLDAAA